VSTRKLSMNALMETKTIIKADESLRTTREARHD
jgi:hypothetical protein